MKFLEHVRSAIVGAAIAALALMGSGPAFAQGFTIPDRSVIQGHISDAQPAGLPPPTASGGTLAASSTDISGTFTASAASGSITFARTWTTAPTCLVVDQSATSTVSMPVYSVSATAITLTTIISTHVLSYFCMGQQSST